MEIDISNKRLEGVFDIEQHCKANGIDVEEVKELYCEYNKLTKLKGLDKLVNLKWLYCEYNKLTELDVSKLVNLEWLHCQNNQLTELDVSKLVNLEWLLCYNNKLTELDVSKLVNLEWLHCQNNQLTELDVSKLVNLESLGYSMNQLTELKGLDKLVNLVTLNGEGYKQPDKRDLILNKIDSLFKRIENVEQNIAEIKRQIRQ